MRRPAAALPALILLCLTPACGPAAARPSATPPEAAPRADATPAANAGRVVDAAGRPLPGALITAAHAGGVVATTVYAGDDGAFRLPALPPGTYEVSARLPGRAAAPRDVALPAAGLLTLTAHGEVDGRALPGSGFLAALPEGEEKRRFVLDCTGCHGFRQDIAAPRGAPRDAGDWAFWTERMLQFAGPRTPFPIIGERDAHATGAWLARHLGEPGALPGPDAAPAPARVPPGVVVTEYLLPLATDLPHDLALDSAGGVLVTGMMSERMYRLEPGSGRWSTVPIPVRGANPRAVEVGPDGRWWVALGMPRAVAVHDPQSGEWRDWPVGVYPHDLVLAGDGALWVNGHFSVDPVVVVRLEPASGETATHALGSPAMPWGGSPIPYGLRAAPDGTLWMTELLGNRLLEIAPDGTVRARHDMPLAASGPRRHDVGPDGAVWIPEYAGGALTRFDPAADRFERIPFTRGDALPYIARVDAASGAVWVATAASNSVARYDPARRCWVEVPLPHPAALVRHIAVDLATGALWGAYGVSPSVAPGVFRVDVPERGGC